MVKLVKIGSVKGNSRNPRFIRDEKFKKLVASLVEFPEMATLRPLVVDENMTVLGGNMRLKAMQELKWKEVPIVIAEGLTDAQKDEFVIKDNVGFGDWNWEQLANEWNAEELTRWGLEIPGFDFSDANEEIDIDSLDTEMVIKLKYTEEEYKLVKEQLSKIASTPEQAVWKLLGNE
jgi:ParB-like chromosome segregation protein Spo0J